jgi:hypothetical protein
LIDTLNVLILRVELGGRSLIRIFA